MFGTDDIIIIGKAEIMPPCYSNCLVNEKFPYETIATKWFRNSFTKSALAWFCRYALANGFTLRKQDTSLVGFYFVNDGGEAIELR